MVGSHLYTLNSPQWAWWMAVVQFLVSPHLMYRLASRAADPFEAEVRNMLAESVLFGVWCAAMGFPVWISFVLLVGEAMNLAAFRGNKGVAQGLFAISMGAIPTFLVVRPGWHPDTGSLTTLLSVCCISFYLVLFARAAYSRTVKLAATREELKASQQSLEASNLALHEKIQQIGQLQDRLERQVNEDALTGLFNRRYFDATLPRELARCQRDNQPLSLILIDIDHFKHINDTFGHPAADLVLQEAARLFAYYARQGDVVCRYGGEEFMLLLPGLSRDTALERAEYIRRTFADQVTWIEGQRVSTTVSIGISCFPFNGAQVGHLVKAADLALYSAKAEGRNRIVLAPASSKDPVIN